jgi:CxxC motif-containing protein
MELICIKCPRGCNLTINGEQITGNFCPRGIDYAKEEMTCPMRIVTALIKVDGKIVPVKTSREVPKEKIEEVLKEISNIKVSYTKIGDIVLSNVLNLNVDIVVTGEPYCN